MKLNHCYVKTCQWFFDGTSANRAIKAHNQRMPVYVPGLEAEEFGEAVYAFIREDIEEHELKSILSKAGSGKFV